LWGEGKKKETPTNNGSPGLGARQKTRIVEKLTIKRGGGGEWVWGGAVSGPKRKCIEGTEKKKNLSFRVLMGGKNERLNQLNTGQPGGGKGCRKEAT